MAALAFAAVAASAPARAQRPSITLVEALRLAELDPIEALRYE